MAGINISDNGKQITVKNLTLAEVKRRNIIGMPLVMPVKLNGVWLPEEPQITLSLRKNISTTQLAGYTGVGTVKQLISMEDYTIRLRGILLNHYSSEYPEEMVRDLYDILKIGANISISSMVTDIFEIERVVVVYADFPEARPGRQSYEIELMSDYDFILEY